MITVSPSTELPAGEAPYAHRAMPLPLPTPAPHQATLRLSAITEKAMEIDADGRYATTSTASSGTMMFAHESRLRL